MGIHLSTATARTLQDKRAVKFNEYYNIDIGYSQAAYLWITDRLFSPVFHYTYFLYKSQAADVNNYKLSRLLYLMLEIH